MKQLIITIIIPLFLILVCFRHWNYFMQVCSLHHVFKKKNRYIFNEHLMNNLWGKSLKIKLVINCSSQYYLFLKYIQKITKNYVDVYEEFHCTKWYYLNIKRNKKIAVIFCGLQREKTVSWPEFYISLLRWLQRKHVYFFNTKQQLAYRPLNRISEESFLLSI